MECLMQSVLRRPRNGYRLRLQINVNVLCFIVAVICAQMFERYFANPFFNDVFQTSNIVVTRLSNAVIHVIPLALITQTYLDNLT